jgi:hypothetical protein
VAGQVISDQLTETIIGDAPKESLLLSSDCQGKGNIGVSAANYSLVGASATPNKVNQSLTNNENHAVSLGLGIWN